jgi:hypothetical protein
MALIANAHRDVKRNKAFSPKDFNPCVEGDRTGGTAKIRDLSILKAVFVDRKGGV